MSIIDWIIQYRLKWSEHLDRTDGCRIPEQLSNYKPKGRRGVGRPKKAWTDHLYSVCSGLGKTNLNEIINMVKRIWA